MRHHIVHGLMFALLASACGEAPSGDLDAGVPTDGAAMAGDAGFVPEQTYPGEGDACEFSMFCEDLQICVDGECQRHERFTAEELEVGAPVQVPDELLHTTRFYTEAPFGRDELGEGSYGVIVPGPDGPVLLVWSFQADQCQIAIIGDGPTRVVGVEGFRCISAAISPEGYLAVGGLRAREVMNYQTSGMVLFDPAGEIVADVTYPEQVVNTVGPYVGRPDDGTWDVGSFMHQPTSFLWHEGRFLFAAAAGPRDRNRGPMSGAGDIPEYPTHTFHGELSLEGEVSLVDVGGSPVHEGSYGWIVRDELGIHSVLTVFTPPYDETLGTRTDLLTWSDGQRQTLVDGLDGLGGTGRYMQLAPDQWLLSASGFPDGCTSTLFDNGVDDGVMTFRGAGCDDRSGVDGHGGSGSFGPVHPGNSNFGWMSMDERRSDGDPPVRIPTVRRQGMGHWADMPQSTVGRAQPISRFGKTLEIYAMLGGAQPVGRVRGSAHEERTMKATSVRVWALSALLGACAAPVVVSDEQVAGLEGRASRPVPHWALRPSDRQAARDQLVKTGAHAAAGRLPLLDEAGVIR